MKTLEVHEHSLICGGQGRVKHSHPGGELPHYHRSGDVQTGPSVRTIDRKEWLEATGLRGGGTKRFTARPNGPQFPTIVSVRDLTAAVALAKRTGYAFTVLDPDGFDLGRIDPGGDFVAA